MHETSSHVKLSSDIMSLKKQSLQISEGCHAAVAHFKILFCALTIMQIHKEWDLFC